MQNGQFWPSVLTHFPRELAAFIIAGPPLRSLARQGARQAMYGVFHLTPIGCHSVRN